MIITLTATASCATGSGPSQVTSSPPPVTGERLPELSEPDSAESDTESATLNDLYECGDRQSPDGDRLRGGRMYDYQPFATIGDAVDTVETAVVGRITDWRAGRSVIEDDTAFRYAVIEVAVDQSFKEDRRDTIYIEFELGNDIVDEFGQVVRGPFSTNLLTIDDAKDAAPIGTPVIFLGDEIAAENDPHRKVVDPDAGLPAGEAPHGSYPQGLLLRNCDGSVTSAMAETRDIDEWVVSEAALVDDSTLRKATDPGSFDLLVNAALLFDQSSE